MRLELYILFLNIVFSLNKIINLMSFSIITAVLNNEKFILDCLKSLKKQKFNKN